MTFRFHRPALAILGAAFLLSACVDSVIVRCPGVAILADASKRAVLKPGAAATDPAAALYTVEMTAVETDCQTEVRQGLSDSTVTLTFRATRPSAGVAAHYTVPYFMAVNQAERILNRRRYTTQVNFGAGDVVEVFQVTLSSNLLKLENGHQPTDYQYLAGLEISDAERAYLATMSRYAP